MLPDVAQMWGCGCHEAYFERCGSKSDAYLQKYASVSNRPLQLRKLGRHRGVAPCELFDRQIVGLVVGESQIVRRLVQRFLGFFQVFDGFVDALDGFFKAFRGQAPIAPKRRLEFVELGLELRDVHILRAQAHGFPVERIIFEVTEGERVDDGPWFAQILREYQRCGFKTAIDDFGAGFAGMKLLADFQPDLIKIDMDLIRNVDVNRPRQAIVRSLVQLCKDMNIQVIAEGIETPGERDFLADAGIRLMQGYLFAKPAFRAVAPLDYSVFPGA